MKVLRMAAVCAVVALGAGAATATADSLITSAKIKNGTIQMVDLSAKTKRALKGARGPQGAQGVPGPAGGFDPAKVTYVAGPKVTIAPGTGTSQTVDCPAGAKALSGGWVVIAGGVGEVYASRSYDSGASWTIQVWNHGEFTDADIEPFVVCAAR
jgi:hypothetical protein